MPCWLAVGFQLKPQKSTTYPPFSRDRDSRPLSPASMMGAFKEVGIATESFSAPIIEGTKRATTHAFITTLCHHR